MPFVRYMTDREWGQPVELPKGYNTMTGVYRVRYCNDRGCYFVNVYSRTRQYGGHEGGGWWYHLYVLREVHVFKHGSAALGAADILRDQLQPEGNRSWDVRIDDRPGDPYFYNTPGQLERPAYARDAETRVDPLPKQDTAPLVPSCMWAEPTAVDPRVPGYGSADDQEADDSLEGLWMPSCPAPAY